MKKNNSGIGFGLFLIFIGIIVVLAQVGTLNADKILSFVFTHIPMLISLLLIVTGINLIFKRHYLVEIVTWTAFFGVLLISANYYSSTTENVGEGNDDKSYSRTFVEEKMPKTEEGRLKMSIGGLKLKIGSTESNLIEGVIRESGLKYEVDYKNSNKTAVVDFTQRSKPSLDDLKNLVSTKSITTRNLAMENPLDILLNSDVVWDIDLNAGGIDADIDLSALKVEKFEMDGGAGNIRLVLGDGYPNAKVDIDAGAAKFKIYVPKSSGVKIRVDGLMNSIDFNGLIFERQDRFYISPNYEEAENKIEIDIDMGAGALEFNAL